MRETLTVIIPCYNEEASVVATVEEVLSVAPSLPVDVQILLIDDGSSDGTRAKLAELHEQHGCILQLNPTNLGLGRSVMKAWEGLDANSWATVLPGDGEIFFDSIHNFLAVRDDHDVILGYCQNPVVRTFTRRAASTAFMRVVSALYGFRHQYLNGMKMYRVGALRGIQVHSGGHAFNAELLAKAMLRDPKLRVGEVPFVWRGRSQGHSKAFQPSSILLAAREVWRGRAEVDRYRQQVLLDTPR